MWVGYDRYATVDPSIDRSTWARMVGEARTAIANKLAEVTRPLNRRPLPTEIVTYTSRRATGYLQWVDVYVKDRETGLVTTQPWNVKSRDLRSRQAVITEALSRYQAATLPEGTFEGQIVVGASYAGTLQYIPQ